MRDSTIKFTTICITQDGSITIPVFVSDKFIGPHQRCSHCTTTTITHQYHITRLKCPQKFLFAIILPFAFLVSSFQFSHHLFACPRHMFNQFIHIQRNCILIIILKLSTIIQRLPRNWYPRSQSTAYCKRRHTKHLLLVETQPNETSRNAQLPVVYVPIKLMQNSLQRPFHHCNILLRLPISLRMLHANPHLSNTILFALFTDNTSKFTSTITSQFQRQTKPGKQLPIQSRPHLLRAFSFHGDQLYPLTENIHCNQNMGITIRGCWQPGEVIHRPALEGLRKLMRRFQRQALKFTLELLAWHTIGHESNAIIQKFRPRIVRPNHVVQFHHTYMSTNSMQILQNFTTSHQGRHFSHTIRLYFVQQAPNHRIAISSFHDVKVSFHTQLRDQRLLFIRTQHFQQVHIHCRVSIIQLNSTIRAVSEWQSTISSTTTRFTVTFTAPITSHLFQLTITTLFSHSSQHQWHRRTQRVLLFHSFNVARQPTQTISNYVGFTNDIFQTIVKLLEYHPPPSKFLVMFHSTLDVRQRTMICSNNQTLPIQHMSKAAQGKSYCQRLAFRRRIVLFRRSQHT